MGIFEAINTKCYKGITFKADWLHSVAAKTVELPKSDVPKVMAEKPMLLITLPDLSVASRTLEVILETATSMECKKDFTLDRLSNDVMAMHFQKHLTKDGKLMYTTIDGVTMTVLVLTVFTTLHCPKSHTCYITFVPCI